MFACVFDLCGCFSLNLDNFYINQVLHKVTADFLVCNV